MKFTDFNLDGGLQEGLAEAGYITCTPVQEQVLQNGLEGADLYVQSQTGTGKTAAYLLPILQRLISDPALAGKKALIMVPTRELAVQVEEEARILGSHMPLKSASFYGGVGYGGQQDLLARGVDIIIGTPGRVIDLQQSGTMKLNEVAFLVIDEADRMFDMGFYPDLRVLIKVLPPAEKRQTLLFSATLNATVKNLAWEYTVEAKEITIEAENVTVTEIEQILYHVSSDEKMKLLLGILQRENPESILIFCNTKRMSEVVAKRLKINGYEADFIIGDLAQVKRLQVIDSFKSKSLRCLVATDVAARGIDVDDLAMVINYDLPNEAENYVHRTGRTARAGKTGKAITFCSEQDVYNLPSIQKYIEAKLESVVASEDMMIEDKSAHMYIRTDRYDNDYADDNSSRGDSRGRGGSRGRSDSRSRPDSRGRGDSRGGRNDGRGRDSAPRTETPYEGRKPAAAATPYLGADRHPAVDPRGGENRGGDPRRRNAPPPQNAQERDLSKLSFEDRMAYYKNKYGSEEAARAAEQQGSASQQGESRNRNGGDSRRGGGQQGGNRPRGTESPRGPNPRRGNSSGEGRPDNRQGGQNRQTSGQPYTGRPKQTGEGVQNARNRPSRNGQVQTGKASAKPASASTQSVQKKEGVFGGLIKKLFGKK